MKQLLVVLLGGVLLGWSALSPATDEQEREPGAHPRVNKPVHIEKRARQREVAELAKPGQSSGQDGIAVKSAPSRTRTESTE